MGSFAYICALNIPDTLPGMPEANGPSNDFEVMGFPFSSKYISLLAIAGAASLKSSPINLPLFVLANKNPPPPILPADGCTTANAKCTAIAASNAFPPSCMMAAPTILANGCADVTAAWVNSFSLMVSNWYGLIPGCVLKKIWAFE